MVGKCLQVNGFFQTQYGLWYIDVMKAAETIGKAIQREVEETWGNNNTDYYWWIILCFENKDKSLIMESVCGICFTVMRDVLSWFCQSPNLN